jgi:hypothetical protein
VGQMHPHDAQIPVFPTESLSSQPSSLGSGHSRTVAHDGEHQHARRLHRWTSRLRLVMHGSGSGANLGARLLRPIRHTLGDLRGRLQRRGAPKQSHANDACRLGHGSRSDD